MGWTVPPLEPLEYKFRETYLPTPLDFFYWQLSFGRKQQCFCLLRISAPTLLEATRPLTALAHLSQRAYGWFYTAPAWFSLPWISFPPAIKGLAKCSTARRPKSWGAGTLMLHQRLHPYSLFPVPNTSLQNNKTDVQLIFWLLGSSAIAGILKSSKVMLVGKDPSWKASEASGSCACAKGQPGPTIHGPVSIPASWRDLTSRELTPCTSLEMIATSFNWLRCYRLLAMSF